MKEVAFIKQNSEKWREFEAIIKKRASDNNIDRLLDLYTELLEDLSYAKTFYSGSKTVNYLNRLALLCHKKIYVKKDSPKNRIKRFVIDKHPLIVRKHYKKFIVSFLITLVAILIGALSAAKDESFLRLILGDTYLKMTLENIKNNDPMAVYKSMASSDMFIAITFNNIKVAFTAFAIGTLFSFGTGYILLQNGIMLGAFHYMFYQQGLLKQSLLTVWIHGSLEIPAIIIAGAAGIILGNSFLFPGTYSRVESFRRGASDSIRIILGIIPIFIIAGFLEGYVTRHTEMSTSLNMMIIIANFSLIIILYLLLPLSKNLGEFKSEKK